MASQRSAARVPVMHGVSGRITIPSQQELSFVNLTDKPTKGWRSTNKVVRAHVMRRYKREQRTKALGQISRNDDSTKTSGTSPSSDAGTSVVTSDLVPSICSDELSLFHSGAGDDPSRSLRDTGGGQSVCDNGLETLPSNDDAVDSHALTPFGISTWLDGSLDPFACLPIQSTPHRLMLLKQNSFTAIRTSVHADPDDLWRRSCSSNPAWMFMTLFYASSRFPHISRQFPVEDANFLVQSISAVNDIISNSPDSISDSTIATVACLANIDNLNGISADATVHTNGLIRMVGLRGGLSNLGMQGLLRRMVLWSDLLASSRLGKPPRFPFYQTDTTLPLSFFTPSAPADVYDSKLDSSLTAITTAKHHISISHLMLSLHQLSVFLNLTTSQCLPREAAYPDRVYEVEYRFLNALFDDQITAEAEEQLAIGEILLHAGLLFIYTNLRETPVGGAIRCRLLARLKTALVRYESWSQACNSTAAMLWVFLLGASACTGAERSYFVEQLKLLGITRNIRKWHDVLTILENAPALEVRRLNVCMELWRDIEISGVDLWDSCITELGHDAG